MKILVLSFYFRPDLSAGSFRATALAESLAAVAPIDATIDVLTTLPNRYSSFVVDAPPTERSGRVTVRRFSVPEHRSGMVDQSKSFATFARAALASTAGQRYDVVFATSSRLMTAFLGALIARQVRAPLYLDIRDIFVDTVGDIASPLIAVPLTPLLAALERWTVGRASRVNLVSPGFEPYFRARYPSQRFSFLTNGVDEAFLEAISRVETSPSVPRGADRPVSVLYAGNVGEGQGLHAILPQLAGRLRGRVRFRIIGDGGRRGELTAALRAAGVEDVEWLRPMPRAALIREYAAADVLFLHLNDHAAFRKVLPSKIFEYAAMGKPIWAGVAGYATEFIAAEIDNAAVFRPCDADDAIRAFDCLRLGHTDRGEFAARFSRARLSNALAHDLLAVARGD